MTIHLAGTPVTIQGRVIQRCLICGHKLLDSKNTAIAMEGNNNHYIAYWPVGGMVEVNERNTRMICLGVLETPEINEDHENFCVELIEL